MTTTTTTSEQKGARIAAKEACPNCGERGRKVRRVTLESLLHPDRRADIGEDQYYVCATPRCDTVYFGASNGQTFRKPDLTVRFGLKETDAPRHVCYCFDHTVEEIHDEIHRTGESTVVESIKADMKGPGCRCEYTNPLGACCLKSVQAAVADAIRSTGNEAQSDMSGVADHGDCCASDERTAEKTVTADSCVTQCESGDRTAATSSDCCRTQNDGSDGNSGRDRAGALAAGGSVVAAILSSACCWLPLVLIAFGASAVGVAGFFEAYRLYFIMSAVGLLAFGFYMIYFRKENCEPGSSCATPNRKLRIFSQAILWTATVLVGTFVFFPNYVGFMLGSPTQAATTVDTAGLASAKFHIEGMTCEGCANILHGALTKLPDVKAAEVDFSTKTAVIRYEPDKPVPPERVFEAVTAAGYSATPASEVPLVREHTSRRKRNAAEVRPEFRRADGRGEPRALSRRAWPLPLSRMS